MDGSTEPVEGGCRCGQVRFRISAAPLLTMACHCTGCQRMTGAPYSLSIAYPSDGFEVIAGEPVIGGMHADPRHYFCPYCMSWMFTRPEQAAWLVNVRATMLDDTTGVSPFMETFTDEALPWAKTPAVRSFPRFPDLDAYEGLTAEFQASRRG
jgi:hypothetical protein